MTLKKVLHALIALLGALMVTVLGGLAVALFLGVVWIGLGGEYTVHYVVILSLCAIFLAAWWVIYKLLNRL